MPDRIYQTIPAGCFCKSEKMSKNHFSKVKIFRKICFFKIKVVPLQRFLINKHFYVTRNSIQAAAK